MATRTTRQQILEFLETKGITTSAELSQVLHVTPADIRHHLANLEKEGLVYTAGHTAVHSKGRPQKQYRLTRSTAAHNLNQLSSVLLEVMKTFLSPDAYGDLLTDLAKRVVHPAGEQTQKAPRLSQRLAAAMLFLNAHHYEARWEAHKNGPQIIFQHCPYHSIIADHPELCFFDQKVIENLLEVTVEQKAKLELNPQGLPYCCFRVRF